MKKLLFAPLLAALLAAPAYAGTGTRAGTQISPPSRTDALADILEVETHRSPAAVVARDAIYGGIAGLAVGAGVALLNSGDNWGRDLMIGAGAGLLVGAIFGAVDAATMSDRGMAIADSSARIRDEKAQSNRSAGVGYGMRF